MSNMLEYRGYGGSVEFSREDRCLHGRIEFIEDLVTFEGVTCDEIEEAFRAAVDDYLETCKAVGKDPDKAFKGTFNVRIGPDLHKRAAVAARKTDQTLNDFVREAVEARLNETPVVRHEHVHKVLTTTNTLLPLTPFPQTQWNSSEFSVRRPNRTARCRAPTR